jgi:flagellin
MTGSIHTNVGAMQALQQLQQTNRNLLDTQNRISTGFKVSNAKDAAATWAIATTMRSDVASFKAISDNLSLSQSSVSTARSAAESIADHIRDIKTKVTSAQNSAVDKAKVQADIDALIGQIKGAVSSAQFNGVNMVGGTGTERVLSSLDRSGGSVSANYIDVDKKDLRIQAGSDLASLDGLTVLSTADDLLTNQADGEKNIAFTIGGPATAAGTINFAYTDKNGKLQSISTSVANTDTAVQSAAKLAANTAFADAGFTVTDKGAGVVEVTAKNRDVNVSFDKTAFTSSATGATVTDGAQKVEMTFKNNVPLKLGDTYDFSWDVSGTAKAVKFEVSKNATGTVLGTDAATGVTTYAINADLVSDKGVTGGTIATEFQTALTTAGGTEIVSGAAVADTNLGTSVVGGKLTITTLTNSDSVGDFKFAPTDYDTLLKNVETSLSKAIDAAASFGSAQTRIDTQKEFVNSLVDSLNTGIGSLVDADMTEESARLQALQVQQQLGTQALSMANQAPQSILSLFR